MALLDFLKRKEEQEKAKGAKRTLAPSKSEEKRPVKKTEKVSVKREGKIKGFSYDIVKEPHISEKATNLSEKNQYVFKVIGNSNKTEIKKSVEGIYAVNVLSVNIIKIPAKKRRIGRTQGFRKGHIKAVVKIAEGQKIEIL